MCARSRRRLTVEDAARLDIEDVLLYTLEHWGAEQRRRYLDKLRRAMRSLLDHPELGQEQDDLYPGCRRLLLEQHGIYYRLEGDEIIVGRVLSNSQDPTGRVHRQPTG